jgi:GT2 family glycosyltransferase
MKRITIIIVNFNTCKMTMDCLSSLKDDEANVIVVDNNSSDGSLIALRKWAKKDNGRTLISNKANLGFAKANNQGIRLADTPYVMLLNSDTLVSPGTLPRLIEWMDEHPAVGACGPRLIYPDGTPQPSPSAIPTPWMYIVRFLGLKYLVPGYQSRKKISEALEPVLGRTLTSHMNPGVTRNSDACHGFLSGAALLVRKEVVDQIGDLDEGYFMYLEDVDWCIRMRDAGWNLGFVSDLDVLHYAGASFKSSQYRTSFRSASVESYRSIMRYLKKYSNPAGRAIVRVVISLSLLAQSLFVSPMLVLSRRREIWSFITQNLNNIAVVWGYDSSEVEIGK